MKKLKFLPLFLLGIMFCFMASVVPGTAVFADSSVVITTKAQKTGDDLVLEATLQQNPGLVACVFTINYDTAVFEQPSVEFASDGGLRNLYPESGVKNGAFKVMWEGLPDGGNDTTTGKLLTLTFKIKNNISDGTYQILLVPEQNSIYGLTASKQNVYYSVGDKNLAVQGVSVKLQGGSADIESIDYDDIAQNSDLPVLVIVLIVVAAVAAVCGGLAVLIVHLKAKNGRKDWKLLDK